MKSGGERLRKSPRANECDLHGKKELLGDVK